MDKFRIWHEGNNQYEYYSIADVWKNGWQNCEATRPNGVHNKIELDERGIFTTHECLDKQSKTPFVLTGKREWFTGFKDNDGVDIYCDDVVKDLRDRIGHKVVWCKNRGVGFEFILQGGTKKWYPLCEFVRNLQVIGNPHQTAKLLESK